jgi:carboxymethylenebutenolidase
MIERRRLWARLFGAVVVSAGMIGGWLKTDALAQGEKAMTDQEMFDLFQKHVEAKLAGDLETTMATISANPHLNYVPTMAGGVGRDGVRSFYRDHLVGKFFPPDVRMETVSRTVGDCQIVEEVFITFTHTTPIDWLLPGVAPTGKPVAMAVAVIVGFKDGKISHEHIYWDQAGVLVQVGLLDPKGLPVCGGESARKVFDPRLPARKI